MTQKYENMSLERGSDCNTVLKNAGLRPSHFVDRLESVQRVLKFYCTF